MGISRKIANEIAKKYGLSVEHEEKRIAEVAEKPLKYRNKITEVNGLVFASRKEAKTYLDLVSRSNAGLITDLELQPRYPMVVNETKVCTYVADFRYIEDGRVVVADVKSPATRKNPVYRLKKKLMRALYNIEILEL